MFNYFQAGNIPEYYFNRGFNSKTDSNSPTDQPAQNGAVNGDNHDEDLEAGANGDSFTPDIEKSIDDKDFDT